MPPKFTPQQPQAGRYWPGKPLKDDVESSSDEEEEEEEELQEGEQQQVVQEPPKRADEKDVKIPTASKLVMTMKNATLSEQGPYMQSEDESSGESESEEEVEEQLEQRTSRVRQARRRAVGDFVAADQVDLEEEEVIVLADSQLIL